MGTISSTVVLLLSAVSISPLEDVPRERVDLIEINHFHDDRGRLVFDQVIFYDWSAKDSRYQVRSWRLLKQANQKPYRDFATDDYVARWNDGDVLREVRAASFRESWTQHDPELIEREFLPKERRRDLVRTAPVSTRKRVAKAAPEAIADNAEPASASEALP